MQNSINFQKRHKYFNGIYDDLHPYNNNETREYRKPKQNFDFFFHDNTLTYSKYKDLDFNENSLSKFKTFGEKDLDPDKRTVQNKISYYLTNNLVPVKIIVLIFRDAITIHLMNLKKKVDFNLLIYFRRGLIK
jgi:hypothetical protein